MRLLNVAALHRLSHALRLPGLALVAAAGMAHADIYVYTDDHGVQTYTNQPRDPRARLILVEPKPVPPPPAEGDGNAAASPVAAGTLQAWIQAAAARNGVEAALVQAVIMVESGFNPRAVSPKGAQGLMQLMPATAQRLGVANPFDPRQNIDGGVRYLAALLGMFRNDLRLALAAYNAGEQAVVQYGNRIPPYRETQDYVPKVLDYYRRFRTGAMRL